MRRFFIHISLLSLFSGLGLAPAPGLAANPTQFTLSRSTVRHVKIFGNDYDRIHFFIQDTSENKFRIAGLSQIQAEDILARFKAGNSITVQTVSNRLGYLDVMSWQ